MSEINTCTKLCPHCHTVKVADDFCRSSQSLDGLYGWCKSCSKLRIIQIPKTKRLSQTKLPVTLF